MKLSVIIVNYNVKYFLEHCLCSVLKATRHIDAEILVVDNHSTDGSRDYLSQRFHTVRFLWNDTNLGFAKANNLALKQAIGEHILFLNPDTIIPEEGLEQCLRFFAERSDCGALGVHMIDGSGAFLRESKRSFPTPSNAFFKMTGLASLFPHSRYFSGYYAGHVAEHETAAVDVLSGAFLMVSRKIINRVQGFDEDFFMYGEDIDLSYRIRQTGFRNFYLGETTIIHFKGESTCKHTQTYTRNFYGAMRLFVKKHYADKTLQRTLMRSAIGLASFAASAKALFRRSVRKIRRHSNDAEPMIMICSHLRFNQMIRIVKNAVTPYLIVGRVDSRERDLSNELSEVRKTYLLFCEGEMPYTHIIRQMKRLGRRFRYLIHSVDSHSIIGSSDRNEQGIHLVSDSL